PPPPAPVAVRRRLGAARHAAPTPPAVVSRLEDALATLQAERADTADRSGTAPVIDLAARRRRRLVGIGVMAAAAVVVAGVAVGQILPQSGSDSGGDSSASSADDGGGADFQAGPESGGDSSAESTSPEELSGKAAAPQVLPEVSLNDDLDEALTALRSESRRASTLTADAFVACQVGEVGQGRQVLVQVDGQPGLVVFRATRGASQEADVYLCGDPEAVRTLTLPSP
ncbi:MAG: hypothetical protein LH477_17355, partial [Nocardioides sp.]|nr:hypothetical protein [Nocardioides sp.]